MGVSGVWILSQIVVLRSDTRIDKPLLAARRSVHVNLDLIVYLVV